jgi:hypothetical protein
MALRFTCDFHASVSSIPFFYLFFNYSYDNNSHSFRDCAGRNIWGNMKIKLMDTMFWQQMTEDLEKYHERYRMKQNLVEYDLVVLPMYGGYVFTTKDAITNNLNF